LDKMRLSRFALNRKGRCTAKSNKTGRVICKHWSTSSCFHIARYSVGLLCLKPYVGTGFGPGVLYCVFLADSFFSISTPDHIPSAHPSCSVSSVRGHACRRRLRRVRRRAASAFYVARRSRYTRCATSLPTKSWYASRFASLWLSPSHRSRHPRHLRHRLRKRRRHHTPHCRPHLPLSHHQRPARRRRRSGSLRHQQRYPLGRKSAKRASEESHQSDPPRSIAGASSRVDAARWEGKWSERKKAARYLSTDLLLVPWCVWDCGAMAAGR